MKIEEIYLKLPTIEDKQSVLELKAEFLAVENRIPGSGSIEKFDTYEEWLEKVTNEADPKSTPEGRVSATQFLTIRKGDGKLLGMVQLRHTLNEYLLEFGGHIGDCIRPSERRKGYASAQIALCLNECKKLNINKVLITCNKKNLASAKTITNNGGILENEVINSEGETYQRYWIYLA